MSEERDVRDQERVFLVLGWLGPIMVVASYLAAWPPLWSLQPSSGSLKFVHSVCLVGSLVAALGLQALVALWEGRPLLFLRKGLSAKAGLDLPAGEAEAAVEQVAARAAALGMSFRAEGATLRRWRLARPKDALVQAFREHAFSGWVSLSPSPSGTTRLTVDLTFEDTLLVESGESRELESLCRELAGLEAFPVERQVPLLLLLAWFYALACAVGVLALGLGLTQETAWLRGPAFVGLGITAYSCFVILRDRDRLTGFRLATQIALTIGVAVGVFYLRATQG